MPERITRQLVLVLDALMGDPQREWFGLELMDVTSLSSGTLYPLLHRLVVDGWLVRTRDSPSDLGGSGRRLYKLTGTGARAAREILEAKGSQARAAAPRRPRGVQPA